MASLLCFKQVELVSVQFQWSSKGCFHVKIETPFVGYGKVSAGQIDVGRRVRITLFNTMHEQSQDCYVAGLYKCKDCLGCPMLLLSRQSHIPDPSKYSFELFTIVLPDINDYFRTGKMSSGEYEQIKDRIADNPIGHTDTRATRRF